MANESGTMPDVAPKQVGKSTTQITVRLDDAMLERIDRVSEHYAAVLRTAFGRSDALRMIIAHGMDAVEAEIGPKKKSAR